MKTKPHNQEWQLSLCHWQNSINAGNSAQFWLGLIKKTHQAKRCPSWQTPQHWESTRCDDCCPGSRCHQTDATDTQIVFHFCRQSHHTQWSDGWSTSYFSLSLSFFFLPQMLEHTCKLVDSHLRSKEANIRLSQLSWAWFRRKCKQLYNSNLIMSPSIYKGGSRRTDSVHTESSESGNIKHINEKLWKPVPSGCGALAPSCSSRGYA